MTDYSSANRGSEKSPSNAAPVSSSAFASAQVATEYLSPLVPGVVQQFLYDNAEQLSKDFSEPRPFVMLFADMSGFSRLGAGFASTFERGAEELRTVMNTLFDAVVSDITQHGGSVLYFAGDAVFAVWPLSNRADSGNGGLEGQVTGQAIRAGLAIQSSCRTLSKGGLLRQSDSELRMRVAIDHGDINLRHVVDNSQQDDCRYVMLEGPLMQRLTELGDRASAEGVFVAANMTTVATDNWVSTDVNNGKIVTGNLSPALAVGSPADAHFTSGAVNLSPYIATETTSQLSSLQSDWLSEYRESQVLFVSFKVHDTSAADVTADTVRIASASVRSGGGQVIQLINDDKGMVLVAAWGLALNSHENNAERAITSGRQIVEACRQIDVHASAGVSYGKLFAGLLGNDSRLSFTLIGDAVNRAAAMMQQAGQQDSGSLLCDEATREATGKRFTFDHFGDVQLKGQGAPAPLFTPRRELLREVDHSGEIVGRQKERSLLESLMAPGDQQDDVVDITRVVHIEGVAGLGKSRLASFFVDQLTNRGITFVKLTADSMRRTVGFASFKPMVAELLPAGIEQSPASAEALIKDLVAEEHGDWIPLLSPVLPFTLDDNAATKALSGGGRSENTRSIMVSLLQSILPADLRFLILEDAHWCDSASWQLIEALERAIPELTIVVVSRPLDLMQLPTEVRRLFSDATLISLEPLDNEETDQLVCNELKLNSVAADAVQLIYKQAEGHPLYTKAFSKSLVDRDILSTEAGYGHLKLGDVALQSVEFPDGLAGVFAEQLAAMPPEVQLTLKVASIQGRLFDQSLLQAVHPDKHNTDELTDHINSGIRAGLIDQPADESGQHRFHHALIVDTIYKLLVTGQRQTLHEAIANNLLQQQDRATDAPGQSNAALLAYHFEQAGNDSKAIDYLQQAADTARKSYSNVETVDFLTRALKLAGPPDKAPVESTTAIDTHQLGVWKFQTAEALRALGLYQRAEEFLIDCAASTDRKPPNSKMQAAGRLFTEFGRFKLKPHQKPIAEPQRSELLIAAAANATLSEIHYELNKIPFALAEILRGANLARQAGGDSNTISKLYIGMALISTSLPWALDGDELQRDALSIAERVGDDPMSSYVLMVSGVYDTGKGRWQSAKEQLLRSIEVGERCGERKNLETSMSCLGNLERLHGNFAEAKQWSKLTLDLSQDRGIDHQIIWSHNGMARDMLNLNQFDELEQTMNELGEMLNDPSKKRDSNDNNHLVYLYSRSISALVNKDFNTAREYLDQIIALVATIARPQVFMIQNVGYYADIVWNLWAHDCDREGLKKHMPTVLKSGAKVAKQYHTGKPLHELALGDDAYYQGNTEKAVQWWQASIESALEREMPFNQAQAAHRIQQLIDAGEADKG
jgi:class 3 adenylate cyclase/tetratricopeptide (TPR) repeat protein